MILSGLKNETHWFQASAFVILKGVYGHGQRKPEPSH